jgi:hypothetical protein
MKVACPGGSSSSGGWSCLEGERGESGVFMARRRLWGTGDLICDASRKDRIRAEIIDIVGLSIGLLSQHWYIKSRSSGCQSCLTSVDLGFEGISPRKMANITVALFLIR